MINRIDDEQHPHMVQPEELQCVAKVRELVTLDWLVNHVGSQVESLILRTLVLVLQRFEELLKIILFI